jgi:DNA-binding transcriptional LysR family regulator
MVYIYLMNLSSLDLNLLRVLDALLQSGSTVRAAETIGLSQPAVSAALGRLRATLDDPLFVRQGQRLEPTEYARNLAAPLRETLDQIERILAVPAAFDPKEATRSFTLSGSDFFAEMLLPTLSRDLADQAPGVQIRMVDMLVDHYHALDNHQLDLALVPEMSFPEWVDSERLFGSEFILATRRDHPALRGTSLRPGDVMPMGVFCQLGHVVMSPEGKARTMIDGALERAGHKRRVVLTMPFFGGVYRTVAQTDLVALLPHQLAHQVRATAGLDLYRLPVTLPRAELYMIWHRRSTANPAHRWIRDQIGRVLRDIDGPNEMNLPSPP